MNRSYRVANWVETMCAELQLLKKALPTASSSSRLSRIAEIVGVPVQAFYGPTADGDLNKHLEQKEEATLLAIVQSYLRSAGPEAGRRFVGAVQAMTAAEAR